MRFEECFMHFEYGYCLKDFRLSTFSESLECFAREAVRVFGDDVEVLFANYKGEYVISINNYGNKFFPSVKAKKILMGDFVDNLSMKLLIAISKDSIKGFYDELKDIND